MGLPVLCFLCRAAILHAKLRVEIVVIRNSPCQIAAFGP